MIKLVRNKRPMAMTVPDGVSEETQAARPASAVSAGSMAERIGLAVHSLSDAERKAGGYAGGLMVEGTAGAAAMAGIQPGDLVLSVNGTPVASREELDTLIAKSGKEIALLIQRDGARSFVSLEVK
jgi:S1-C subfamily serine protease